MKKQFQAFPKFWPIVSSRGTFNYDLTRFLCDLLSPLVGNDYSCKENFSFISQIKNANPSKTFVVSYDVTSLFTIISFQESIATAINFIFNHNSNLNITKRENVSFSLHHRIILFSIVSFKFLNLTVSFQQWVFKFNSNWNPMLLCPIKWWPLKFFATLHSHLLISNIVKGAVSDLRRFLATESPWKIMKNTFYFIWTNWIYSWQMRILHIKCIFIKPNVWYLWGLAILAIKRWLVSFQFCKNFSRPPLCGGWTKKLQTFSRHFFWGQPSKYCISEFTAIFVSLLLSWSRQYSMKWSSNFDGP